MDINELEDENQELSLHLADMLEVALIYAGAKKDKIEKIAKLYVDNIDEALKDDDSDEMDREDIITVIEFVRSKNPELFS